MIRAEDDLLQPAEIRAIRESLGLTQRKLEMLLRVGPKPWFAAKEARPSRIATDSLLRVIREFPEAARFLAERSGVSLPGSAA